jgi:Zn-dependent protease with chaperone function
VHVDGNEGNAVAASTVCPQCGEAIAADLKPLWCDACNWNVVPVAPIARSRRQERAQRRADRRGERLYQEMAKEATEGTRRHNLARLASDGLAVAVHLPLLILIAFGAWLWVAYDHPLAIIPTVIILLLAYTFRPRFPRVPKGVLVIPRADAPTLYSVVDDLSRLLGTRPVAWFAIDACFTAAITSVGIRRHRLIVFGLPLWDVLTPQERIAVISHEIGHDLGGDLVHSAVVSSSLRTLAAWHEILRPVPRARQKYAYEMPALFQYLVGRLFRLQVALHRRANPRAEYRADEAAASVASTAAITAFLDKHFLVDKACAFISVGVASRDLDIWSSLQSKLAVVPTSEHERLRRAARLKHHAVDARHPPTALRIDLLRARPDVAAMFQMSDAIASATEEELAVPRKRLAQMLASGDATAKRTNQWLRSRARV